MDEMEIITFTKDVTRRLGRLHSLKKHQSYSNQMNLKRYKGHQGLLMMQARKNKSLIKHQGQAIEKRPLQRQEKKQKRPHSRKKHQSQLNLLTQSRKKKGHLRMIKRKK